MLSKIIGSVLGALLGALNDHLRQRRQEAALKELGKVEEKLDAHEANLALQAKVRLLEHRLASDPEYAERVRNEFARSKGA